MLVGWGRGGVCLTALVRRLGVAHVAYVATIDSSRALWLMATGSQFRSLTPCACLFIRTPGISLSPFPPPLSVPLSVCVSASISHFLRLTISLSLLLSLFLYSFFSISAFFSLPRSLSLSLSLMSSFSLVSRLRRLLFCLPPPVPRPPPPPPRPVCSAPGSQGAVALSHLRGDAAQGTGPVFTPDGGGEGQAFPDATAHSESVCLLRVRGGVVACLSRGRTQPIPTQLVPLARFCLVMPAVWLCLLVLIIVVSVFPSCRCKVPPGDVVDLKSGGCRKLKRDSITVARP